MNELPELSSVEELLFSSPLYKSFNVSSESVTLMNLTGRNPANQHEYRFDAHCPYCGKHTTWTVSHGLQMASENWKNRDFAAVAGIVVVTCGRERSHKARFWIELNELVVQKIGQAPSLADISNDEAGSYRRQLGAADAAEFHKAIGLAAHGVGVGSFVYLRRVFENLIARRYAEFKATEGWLDEDFLPLRMSEKVEFLKSHLPTFLVENAKIYSILSLGIHELSEEKCLSFFDVLKESILIILAEDKKKTEEVEAKKRFSKAISEFKA